MSDFLLMMLFAIPCLFLGSYHSDQATLKDCATKGTAKMLGGGTIKCEVVKEKEQS